MRELQGLLFDLDGVIVDTAKYHYLAWKVLADELGIPFDEKDNERLKGVSRMTSFEIILEIGHRTMPQEKKDMCCGKKNEIYLSYIQRLRKDEVLPGVRHFLQDALAKGYKTALGSSSKNSVLILERLGLSDLFNAVIDGTKVVKAKPDPEVFIRGADELQLPYKACVVFEDAVAGILAAHDAGMKVVGIGDKAILYDADLVLPGFKDISIDQVFSRMA